MLREIGAPAIVISFTTAPRRSRNSAFSVESCKIGCMNDDVMFEKRFAEFRA